MVFLHSPFFHRSPALFQGDRSKIRGAGKRFLFLNVRLSNRPPQTRAVARILAVNTRESSSFGYDVDLASRDAIKRLIIYVYVLRVFV